MSACEESSSSSDCRYEGNMCNNGFICMINNNEVYECLPESMNSTSSAQAGTEAQAGATTPADMQAGATTSAGTQV